ncbi:MAG: superoxide dismutase family protein [Lachnospiraceae bacterium]
MKFYFNNGYRLKHNMVLISGNPQAVAEIKGTGKYNNLTGKVQFFELDNGVMVAAEFFGLPIGEVCKNPVFAFHIHSGNRCTGNMEDPFADAMGHFNPGNCMHPYHAGDLPPVFDNNGYAFQMFLTNRFSVDDIIGKTVILHSNPDDFTTQPSGNSGNKIACGVIEKSKEDII